LAKILLIEYKLETKERVESLLTAEGLEFDYEPSLVQFRGDFRNIDLIISPFSEFKSSSENSILNIKSKNPGIEIIIITDSPVLEESVESFRAGAVDYIDINNETNVLINSIRETLVHAELQKDTIELHNNSERIREKLKVLVEKKNKELSELYLKFDLAVEASSSGLWIRDLKNETQWISPQYKKLLGYEDDEFLDSYSDWLRSIHPEDKERVLRKREEAIKNSSPYEIEYRIKLKNNTFKWFYVRGIVLNDEEGIPSRFAGSIQDIDKRKKYEKLLKANESRLSYAAQIANVGIWEWNIKQNDVYWSDEVYRIFGVEKSEENLYKHALSRLFKEDKNKFTELFDAKNYKSNRKKIEVKIISDEGRIKNLLIRTYLKNDRHDHPYFLRLIIQDISDITRREQALKEAIKINRVLDNVKPEEIYKTVLTACKELTNSSLAALWLKDENNNFNLVEIINDFRNEEEKNRIKNLLIENIEFKSLLENHKPMIKNDTINFSSVSSYFKRYIFVPVIWEDGNELVIAVFDKFFQYDNLDIVSIQLLIENSWDVKKRKDAESELEKRAENFKEFTDTLPLGVFEVDKLGKFTFLNKFGLERIGYNKEDIKNGLSSLSLFAEEDKERIKENFTRTLKGEFLEPSEYTFVKKSGDTFPGFLHSNPILENGKTIGIRGIVVDITQRKISEEEIRKLSRSVEQSPVSIIITNLDGEIIYVNHQFCTVTGYSKEEVLGQNPRILKSGETSTDEYGKLWKAISSGLDWRGEFHNKRKNGELFWEMAHISPIKDENGKITHYLAIKEDITEQKRITKELVEAKEKAESTDRLKSEFLAQMSHEIRTPINAIVSFSSLLQNELEDKVDEDLNISFSMIEKASKRIIRTIDLLLNLSEIQVGSLEAIKKEYDLVKDVIKGIFSEFKQLAEEKNVDLNLMIDTQDTMSHFDLYTVTQIFSNLIDNGIKYTDQGKVDIVLSRNSSGNLIASVVDTGIGISEEYLPELFTPFSQEERGYTRRFDGNGIGLALVREYCKINDIELSVKSKKGEGTRFDLIFIGQQISE